MIHSKRSQEGYLLIDHRFSPGVTLADIEKIPLVRRYEFFPAQQLFEAPTLRCSHCGTMVIINPARTRDRHYCSRCDHYICDNPICVLECAPLMMKVETGLENNALLLNVREV